MSCAHCGFPCLFLFNMRKSVFSVDFVNLCLDGEFSVAADLQKNRIPEKTNLVKPLCWSF